VTNRVEAAAVALRLNLVDTPAQSNLSNPPTEVDVADQDSPNWAARERTIM
jgi:hypothetical protein